LAKDKNKQQETETPSDKLATTQSTTTALATLDFEADAQVHSDDFQREDFAMPFLKVIQSNSPEVDETSSKLIKGAVKGMLFLSTSKALFNVPQGSPGLAVIPVAYEHKYIEWKLRESGGGFVADHGWVKGKELAEGAEKNEKGQLILENGNQIVETMQYLLLIIDPSTMEATPALLALTSTQLKKGREWNTKIDTLRVKTGSGKSIRPPMYASTYILNSIPEKNDKGSWYGITVQSGNLLNSFENGPELYAQAKALRESVAAGSLNTDNSYARSEGDESGTDGASEAFPT
jgi:hypothetical protein